MHLFSDRGTPASLRHMNAYSGHTYKFTKNVGTALYIHRAATLMLSGWIIQIRQNPHQDCTGGKEPYQGGGYQNRRRKPRLSDSRLVRSHRTGKLPDLECLCTGHGARTGRTVPVEYFRHDQGVAAQGLSAQTNRQVDHEPQRTSASQLLYKSIIDLALTSPSLKTTSPTLSNLLSRHPPWSLVLRRRLIRVSRGRLLRSFTQIG